MIRQDEICQSSVYIGNDGNNGFKHGKRYDIRVLVQNQTIYVGKQHGDIELIPYGSVSALIKDWDFKKE